VVTVRLDDSRPTYLQVADVLRGEIRSGRFSPGDRLPSVRDLSVRFDIAAATVQSALRVLRDEGLIASRSTRGYFIADAPVDPEAGDAGESSSDFGEMREQLEALTSAVRSLGDRVSQLEAAVLPTEGSPSRP
jgi:Predicted transcriptional regulators